MAHRLLDRKIKIDAFISSPARRARKTASLFAKEYKTGKDEIILEPTLYEAGEEAFYKVIEEIKDKSDTIAVFSHNPGITSFANDLTDARIDNIPTCSIFAVSADCKKWKDFRSASKQFLFFEKPKETSDV